MAENDDLSQIIDGCKGGHNENFSRLVDIYGGRIYGYFYRLTGNKEISNDLLSELFVKIVERIKTYKGGSFEAWLFKTASNIFYDYLRSKQQQKKVLEASKSHLKSQTAQPKYSNSQRTDELQIQLNQMDADIREAIILRFYSQLSFKELAEIRGEPLGTVLSKVHRGLKKLREMMEK